MAQFSRSPFSHSFDILLTPSPSFILGAGILQLGRLDDKFHHSDSKRTEWSNWILHRILKYYICCFRDAIIEVERDLSNTIQNTSIYGV